MTIETLCVEKPYANRSNEEIDDEIRSIVKTAAIPIPRSIEPAIGFIIGLYACALFLAITSFVLPEVDRMFWFSCSAIIFVAASLFVDLNKKKKTNAVS